LTMECVDVGRTERTNEQRERKTPRNRTSEDGTENA